MFIGNLLICGLFNYYYGIMKCIKFIMSKFFFIRNIYEDWEDCN